MKAIVIGLNWLGDIIMSMPAILAAQSRHEIHIVTRPHLAEVYRLFGKDLNIHTLNTQSNIFQITRELKPLRALSAAKTVVLPDSFRAAVIAKLCQSSEIIGFNTQWRGLLLQRKVSKPDNFKKRHESDLHFLLVQEAKLAFEKPNWPDLKFAPEIHSSLKKKTGFELHQPYFVLAPGAAFGAAKRWPPKKFAELADLLHKHYDYRLIITGSSGEMALADEIIKESSAPFTNLAGQTTLTELALLLSDAQAMIANDSGTMHLGAIYQTPTVVPVGPTDMVRTGPLNPNCKAVISTLCPQAPCRQKVCPRQDHICMQSISAAEVFAELQKLLK